MPVPSFVAPHAPSAGDVLGSTHLNLFVRAVEYLHGLAAGGEMPFSGVNYVTDNNGAGTRWVGYFTAPAWTLAAQRLIYNNFTAVAGTGASIEVTHNGGTLTFAQAAFTSPLDISAGTFTTGTKYKVSLINGGNFSDVRVSFAYVPVPLSVAWVAPTTFTDANTSAAADFTPLVTDCTYLRELLEIKRHAWRGVSTGPYLGSTVTGSFYGSFVYRGLNTLDMHGSFVTTGYMKVFVNNTEVASITSGNLPATYDLSALSLSVGTRYIVRVDVNSDPGDRGAGTIKRLYVHGNKTLTNMPQRWTPGDYGYASSGANRLQYISQSLTDIKALCDIQAIGGTDYGVQYLTTDNRSPAIDSVTAVHLTFQDFKFTRKFRWLLYLPTDTDATGTLTYGDATESLPDNNADGTWTALDLETLPLLPYGFAYKVTAVLACFESPTST